MQEMVMVIESCQGMQQGDVVRKEDEECYVVMICKKWNRQQYAKNGDHDVHEKQEMTD